MRFHTPALVGHPPQNPALHLLRLSVVVAALVASLIVAIPRVDAALYPITHPVHPDHLDRVHWSDTFGAPRSGGRSHIGVDIMGPKMTPLVAVNDSVVTWGEFDNAGGNIVRIRDTNGWEFQYIHVNNDSPGTDDGQASCRQAFAAKICETLEGDRIKRGLEFKAGELIAFMGDSGNAEWTASHLHFEVYAPNGDGSVSPVNPTPYVDAAAISPVSPLPFDPPSVGPLPVNPPPLSPPPADPPPIPDVPLPRGAPWPDVATATNEIFAALEGRPPVAGEAGGLVHDLSDHTVAEALAGAVQRNNSAAMIDRLYLIFFGRTPELDGYDYWIDRRADGESLEDIAEWFAQSAEFQRRYGSGTFEDFLNRLYLDVLKRQPDQEGNRYWLDKLERGEVSRGTIVVYFSEGDEAVGSSQLRTERTLLARILTRQRPTEDQIAQWIELRSTNNLPSAIEILLG